MDVRQIKAYLTTHTARDEIDRCWIGSWKKKFNFHRWKGFQKRAKWNRWIRIHGTWTHSTPSHKLWVHDWNKCNCNKRQPLPSSSPSPQQQQQLKQWSIWLNYHPKQYYHLDTKKTTPKLLDVLLISTIANSLLFHLTFLIQSILFSLFAHFARFRRSINGIYELSAVFVHIFHFNFNCLAQLIHNNLLLSLSSIPELKWAPISISFVAFEIWFGRSFFFLQHLCSFLCLAVVIEPNDSSGEFSMGIGGTVFTHFDR